MSDTARQQAEREAAASRVMARADRLATLSETADALTRVYLSPEHLQANQLVGQWMQAAGMMVWQDSVGNITPNTLNTRIKELREAGVVSHGGDGYSLTLSGQDLLKRLSDLQAFAVKWQAGQQRKALAPAPAVAPATAAPAAADLPLAR